MSNLEIINSDISKLENMVLEREGESNLLESFKKLAEQGLTSREISENLKVSYSHVRKIARTNAIEVKRSKNGLFQKAKIGTIDKLIMQGKTLREIGRTVDLTYEGVRQYIIRSDQGEEFKKQRDRSKKEEALQRFLQSEGYRKKLIGGIVHGIFQRAYENETEWEKRKATEYIVSTNFRTNYSFDKLTKIFRLYKKAKEKGKKLSLNEFQEKTGIGSSSIGGILHRVGLEPMYGSLERRRNLLVEELIAVKRAGKIDMSAPDLAYFTNLAQHSLIFHFSRLKVKRPIIKTCIKSFGRAKVFTYRLASQIYEAHDAGYFKEFSIEEMADFFDATVQILDYALSEKRNIAPRIGDALKIIYPERKSIKPYRIASDILCLNKQTNRKKGF